MRNRIIFLIFFFSGLPFKNCNAENYALLIGIDHYIHPDTSNHGQKLARSDIHDLKACVNDVTIINQILSTRFGFLPQNTTTILNENATRDEIILAFYDLLDKCKKGDVFFFYFAGHGSQMMNTLSHKPDKMDETIVPADGIFYGKDIRDIEIAQFLEALLKKGVIVTAMFESCHSGAIARGLDILTQSVTPSNDTISDASISPQPEKEGALILSACQDFQLEYQARFPDGIYYSCFTKAFMDVMKRNNSYISASDLFYSMCTEIKNMGRDMVPVIGGTDERLKRNLFGSGTLENLNHIVAKKILPDNTIILEAGKAAGIEEGTELVSLNKKITIEVESGVTLFESNAKIILGNQADLIAGTVFEISRYSFAPGNKLMLCIPTIAVSRNKFLQMENQIAVWMKKNNMTVVGENNTQHDYMLYYNEGKWFVIDSKNEHMIGATLNTDSLSKYVQNGKTMLVHLPVYNDLMAKMTSEIKNKYSTVVVSSMGNSDYFLAGGIKNNQFGYQILKTDFNVDSASEYPVKSSLLILDTTQENNLCDKLCENLWKLSRIKSWLTLDSRDGVGAFPYSIYFKNTKSGNIIQGGTVDSGEQYKMYIRRNTPLINSDSVKKRWVYVFVISEDGSITKLFPNYASSIENYLPINLKDSVEELYKSEVNVDTPFGVDHIICLTSAEPLPNPEIIEQEGITTRGVSNNPLEELITNLNATTRSVETMKAPEEWSIQKIKFKSVAK